WMPYVDQSTVLLMAPALILGAMLLSALASSISLRRYLRT
ncbi:MAG: ABC transporter permease, partial [Bifidobacterium sp.]|nr:ABC transporter permease [Bifidobacterium sp.]